jgi:hypothetical protein
MGSIATPSSGSASAWSGKSLVDATNNERLGQVVINNNLGAAHSFDGLEHTKQGAGDIVDIVNRGASPVTFNANGTAAPAKDRFASAVVVPANGKARIYYNGTQWEPYAEGGLAKFSTVASAATVVPNAEVMALTGTTTITAITTTNLVPGQVIRFIFGGAITLTNGASIMLAGAANFVGTADDTISLVYDGTKLREIARAVN